MSNDQSLTALLGTLPVPEHRQGFWDDLDAQLTAETEHSSGLRAITDPNDPSTRPEPREVPDNEADRHRRAWWGVVALAAAAFIIAAVFGVHAFRDDDPPLISEIVTPTTTAPIPTDEETEPDTIDVDVALEWTLAASFDGWLENPVAFRGGIAALRRTVDADGYHSLDGELWISADGVDWEPAPDQPPGSIDELAGHGGDLFALQSQVFSDGGGLWVLGSEGWREVMVDEGIEGAAIGPERIVVFHDGALPDPFELLGVFDTETLEPVEFSGLPDLGVEGLLYEGRVAALDDGFLAVVSWIVAPEEVERRTLYSADGSMWVEHPTVTSDDVGVWETSWWPEPATYAGVNLVAGPGYGLLVTDDGLEFDEVPSPVAYDSPVTATEAGFFMVAGGEPDVFHSTDGSEWRRLETPPTWAAVEIGEEGFVSGTVLTIDDDLHAFTIRGVPQGFGAVDDPVTEIWRADASDL